MSIKTLKETINHSRRLMGLPIPQYNRKEIESRKQENISQDGCEIDLGNDVFIVDFNADVETHIEQSDDYPDGSVGGGKKISDFNLNYIHVIDGNGNVVTNPFIIKKVISKIKQDIEEDRFSDKYDLNEGFFDNIKAGASALGDLGKTFKYKKAYNQWEKQIKNIKNDIDGVKNILTKSASKLNNATQYFDTVKSLGSSMPGFNTVEKTQKDVTNLFNTVNNTLASYSNQMENDINTNQQTTQPQNNNTQTTPQKPEEYYTDPESDPKTTTGSPNYTPPTNTGKFNYTNPKKS